MGGTRSFPQGHFVERGKGKKRRCSIFLGHMGTTHYANCPPPLRERAFERLLAFERSRLRSRLRVCALAFAHVAQTQRRAIGMPRA